MPNVTTPPPVKSVNGEEGDVTVDTLGAGADASAKSTDNASRDVAANVLNLYLDDSDLIVKGPDPVSNAGVTEPVKSVVFNTNYSREQYGKHLTSPKIPSDADKASLMTDSNMTADQKALSVISALEYQNGLRVVKNNITDSEFSNQFSEPDLDEFNRYPEEIFVNASELNSTSKQQFIFDAIVVSEDAMDGLSDSNLALQSVTTLDIAEAEIDSNDMARGKYLMARAGGDHTAVDAFTDVVSNESQITTIAQSEDAVADLDALPNAIDDVVASSTAMNAMSASQTAVDFIGTNSNLFDDIINNRYAVGKFVAGLVGLTPSNFVDIDAVASDAAAMDAVSASSDAMDAVSASSDAMDAVSASSAAMNAILSSGVGGNAYWNAWTVDTSSNDLSIKRTFDLSNSSSLEVEWSQNNDYYYGDLSREVIVGGNTLLSESSEPGRITESFDVSSYGGGTTVKLNYTVDENRNRGVSVSFSNGESFVQISDGLDTLDIYRILLS